MPLLVDGQGREEPGRHGWVEFNWKGEVQSWTLEEQDEYVDILPGRTARFQESLLGLPLSTTRLTLRSCLTNAEVDVFRGV